MLLGALPASVLRPGLRDRAYDHAACGTHVVGTESVRWGTEGCGGEACRLVTEPMTEGVLLTEQGRRVGVVEVRGDGLKGWTFKDIEGRRWRLRGRSDRLEGTVSDRRKRQTVSCRLAPRGGQE
jgi:hypothetical protein